MGCGASLGSRAAPQASVSQKTASLSSEQQGRTDSKRRSGNEGSQAHGQAAPAQRSGKRKEKAGLTAPPEDTQGPSSMHDRQPSSIAQTEQVTTTEQRPSSRMSYSQLRPVNGGNTHRAESASSQRFATRAPTRDTASPSPPPADSQQQQQHESDAQRMSNQSLVCVSSLLDVTDMSSRNTRRLSTADARRSGGPSQASQNPPSQQQQIAGSATRPSAASTSPGQVSQQPPQQKSNGSAVPSPSVTVGGSSGGNGPAAAATPATVDGSTCEIEYLSDGSEFDFDSDEDSSTPDENRHLPLSTPPLPPSSGRFDSSGNNHLSHHSGSGGGRPVSRNGGAGSGVRSRVMIASPASAGAVTANSAGSYGGVIGGSLLGGGGTSSLRRSADTVSLVSLADNSDGLFTPSTPRSDPNEQLVGQSPIFARLAAGGNAVNSSRPNSAGGLLGAAAARSGRLDQSNSNGLAVFYNQPRECAICKNPTVAFACEVCDDFFLCEDCRFDVEAIRTIHDPTHAMLSIQDNHCNSSRSFGGDSIFSLSGEGGVSSIFNPPCSGCGRAIDDTEPVYRCELCDYVLCQECHFQPPPPKAAAPASDMDSPHEHKLKRFQRKPKANSVHEGAVVNKSRSSGGNRIINDYVVVRLLGRGSYAKVKLVQHIRTQELFALKILKKQKKAPASSGMNLGRSRAKLANSGVSDDDLLREIAVMKFINHPNITRLKEVIEDVEAQKVYVIMEFCENGPVHVLNEPPLPIEVVQRYAADIMRGLLHLHSEFLYHRDIKPANCLVNNAFVVKIADFGTCNSQIRSKTTEGSPAFSCPEKIRGEEVSGEVVDSWAYALTLHEMAYGTLPVSTTSLFEHRNMLLSPDPIPVPQDGDPQLRDLLTCMLEKQLKRRMLLATARRHPFLAQFNIDIHGTPADADLLGTPPPPASPSQPQPPSQVRPGSASALAQPREPPQALADLYDKALGTVHRGKNLKDCFHGVRALRRIRRKEAETARHNDEDGDGASCDEDDDVVMNGEEDDDGVRGRGGGGRISSGYGTSQFGSDEDDNEPAQSSDAVVRAKEMATADAAVEEAVQHHLASRDAKVEVLFDNLSARLTLERLNRLSATVSELRLSHNALSSTAGLRFDAFAVLKDIAITFNRLEAFPEGLLQAPRLVRLDLSHNYISLIPASLATCAPFLERLNLHHNRITYVGTATIPATPLPTPPPPNTSSNTRYLLGSANGRRVGSNVVSVLAAPCLRHVRLSGNPMEALPEALDTTHHLELVLDAIPALMEQWEDYAQTCSRHNTTSMPGLSVTPQGSSTSPASSALISTGSGVRPTSGAAYPPASMRFTKTPPPHGPAPSSPGGGMTSKLPAVIVWDDTFPVRIPNVEPAVWIAINNMAVYRVQTLRTCKTRRVVLCQCADALFPNGAFSSAELENYFTQLAKAMELRRQQRLDRHDGSYDASAAAADAAANSGGLPPIVGRAARSYVESYFFVTDDGLEDEGGYFNLTEYIKDAFAANEPLLIVMTSNGSTSQVRTNILGALGTCLANLQGKAEDEDAVKEQAALILATVRSIYA